jgi:hypothetical protein
MVNRDNLRKENKQDMASRQRSRRLLSQEADVVVREEEESRKKRLKVVAENSSLDHISVHVTHLAEVHQEIIRKRGIGQSIPLQFTTSKSWPIVVAPMRLQAVHPHPFLFPTQKRHHRSDQLANAPHPRLVKSSCRQALCHLPLDQPTSNSILPPIPQEPLS